MHGQLTRTRRAYAPYLGCTDGRRHDGRRPPLGCQAGSCRKLVIAPKVGFPAASFAMVGLR